MIKKNSTMSNESSLLIVGGTGFIGSYVAKEAISRGFHVCIISKNTLPQEEKIKNVEYIQVDITNKEVLFLKLNNKSFAFVINLGGYINHTNFFDDGIDVLQAHFAGTVNLISCLDKTNLKSFIQIGSSDEYGLNVAPQNENQRELPISTYSFAKTASTHFLQMLHKTEDFPVVILRLFLVYGPKQRGDRFIPQIIQGCIENKEFPVSFGEQLRDFSHVDDIAEAIFLALNNENAKGEVINIASGEPISIKDVISLIQSFVGSGKPIFGLLPYRTGENMELYADISKADRILGWFPKVKLFDGLQKIIDQYAGNL
jgi:nucleoside-diphosphate-sugar epimerase